MHYRKERTGPHATTPAVHKERATFGPLELGNRLKEPGNVGRYEPRAQLPGRKLIILIEGSHRGPLVIAKDRQVHSAGNAVLGEFPRAPDVYDPILMENGSRLSEADLILFERQHNY